MLNTMGKSRQTARQCSCFAGIATPEYVGEENFAAGAMSRLNVDDLTRDVTRW